METRGTVTGEAMWNQAWGNEWTPVGRRRRCQGPEEWEPKQGVGQCQTWRNSGTPIPHAQGRST